MTFPRLYLPPMPEGFLMVDKPRGMTSHDVVARVRKASGVRKVGHAGTLDPMATGVVVAAVGRTTRLIRFVQDLPKEYLAVGRFGVATDSLDADGVETAQEMLEAAGFTATRWYTEMRRDLSLEIPQVALSSSRLSVEPWDPALDDAVRRAHNDAFKGQWGAELHTPETWVQGRTYFAPSWSFVALDRTSDRAQVAGYLISGRYEGDWPAQGWTEGYTEILGVRTEWRGMRVATALLTAAMRAYAADGMEYAGLGVDFSEPGGNYGLFGQLGYEPTRGSLLFTRTI